MTAAAPRRTLASEVTGPLRGIRILDLTGVVFGAYATQILGDAGADVIKVEFPGGRRGSGGDIMRWAGAVPEGAPEGLGPIFMTLNRNKRSWLLDLRVQSDAAALRAMLTECDVFATTVRAEGMARLGLDYDAVRAIKPDIVYVHGSGYGSDGPYAGEPAYDDLIQAAAGLADLLPITDGGEPRYMPTLLADKVSGLFMAQAITAALLHRERTGEGQFVEVPMLECVTSFNLAENMFGHVYDPPNGPWAYPRVATTQRRPFPTADGFISVLPYNDAQWVEFFRLGGWDAKLAADSRFADHRSRIENAAALYALVEEVTPNRTTAEWLELLRPLNIPVAPVNRLHDLFDDPHLAAVELFERYDHPRAGAYNAIRSPLRYARTPANIRRHPPELGEHNDELFAEAKRLGREQEAQR